MRILVVIIIFVVTISNVLISQDCYSNRYDSKVFSSNNEKDFIHKDIVLSEINFLQLNDCYFLKKRNDSLYLYYHDSTVVLYLNNNLVYLNYCYRENYLPTIVDYKIDYSIDLNKLDRHLLIDSVDIFLDYDSYCLEFELDANLTDANLTDTDLTDTDLTDTDLTDANLTNISSSSFKQNYYIGLIANGNFMGLNNGYGSNINLMAGSKNIDFGFINFSPKIIGDSREQYSRFSCDFVLLDYLFFDINNQFDLLNDCPQFDFINHFENERLELYKDNPFIYYISGIKFSYNFLGKGLIKVGCQSNNFSLSSNLYNIEFKHEFKEIGFSGVTIFDNINKKINAGFSVYSLDRKAKFSYLYNNSVSYFSTYYGSLENFIGYINLFIYHRANYTFPNIINPNFVKISLGYYSEVIELFNNSNNKIRSKGLRDRAFLFGMELGVDVEKYFFKINFIIFLKKK